MERIIEKGNKVVEVCTLVGISRQAYYRRIRKGHQDNDLYNEVEKLVIKDREKRSRAGLRSIFYKEGLSSSLGVNRFEKEMSQRGHALKVYRTFIKTTNSRGQHYRFDNLIEGMEITGVNQVIVGDITYYWTSSGLYYIFTFTDIYSKEMKGINGDKNMAGINDEKCLRQVLRYNNKKDYTWGMICHTDGGGQYRSEAFQLMLKRARIKPSHAKNCLENGLAERMNGITKNEYLIDYNIRSVKQLNKVLKQIQFQYNEVWPSAELGWRTPKEYAQWVSGLPVKDRPVKKVKEVNKSKNGFSQA